MKDKESLVYGAIWTAFTLLLFAVFLTLKLCGVIDWAWVWVFAPIWAFPAVSTAFIALMFAIYAVYLLVTWIKRKKMLKEIAKTINENPFIGIKEDEE